MLAYALEVGPRCGSVILIGIDGRSGAGKTTVAEQVAGLAGERGLRTTIIHNDVLCPGWDGLPEIPARLDALARQLAETGTATYPTWDWLADRPGAPAGVPPSDVVIVEGVAAIDPAWAALRSVSVLVEAPAPTRKRRAIQRDGDSFARHWDHWAAAEDRYFALNPPRPDILIELP